MTRLVTQPQSSTWAVAHSGKLVVRTGVVSFSGRQTGTIENLGFNEGIDMTVTRATGDFRIENATTVSMLGDPIIAEPAFPENGGVQGIGFVSVLDTNMWPSAPESVRIIETAHTMSGIDEDQYFTLVARDLRMRVTSPIGGLAANILGNGPQGTWYSYPMLAPPRSRRNFFRTKMISGTHDFDGETTTVHGDGQTATIDIRFTVFGLKMQQLRVSSSGIDFDRAYIGAS